MTEVYNRVTIYGAFEVKIDVNQAVFDEFMKMFYDPKEMRLPDGKGYSLLGNFVNMVYKNGNFSINHAEPGSLDGVISTDVRMIKKEDVVNSKGVVEGSRVGLDIGGSDLKAVVVRDGKVVAEEIIRWSPKTITNPYAMNGFLPIGHIPMIKGYFMQSWKKPRKPD